MDVAAGQTERPTAPTNAPEVIEMEPLEHVAPDCAGRWQRRSVAGEVAWQCSHCGGAHRLCAATSQAVAEECLLDMVMFTLAAQGRRLLNPALGDPGA